MNRPALHAAPMRLALALSLLFAASGCSTYKAIFGSSDPQPVRREQPLEVPPDLTSPAFDERYAMPDPRTATSLTQYSRDRATQPQGTPVSMANVLPAPVNARIERSGDQRWIVAKADPTQVWAVVRAFWLDAGFAIAREVPQAGILETDWRDSRATVERGGLRGLINRALPGNFSSGERDRFRTRLERGIEPGTTEIFVSHRGLEEVFVSTSQDQTRWVPRGTGTDRDLEAEMLGRILAKLGEPAKPAPAMVAQASSPPGAPAAAPAPLSQASLDSDGRALLVREGFERGWRRVGLALDRVGFTVEDRDRSSGTYFVRYIDPDAPAAPSGPILDKLAFWRPAPKPTQPQYRIRVEESPPGTSRVTVQNAKGEPDTSSTGKRILNLLLEQLR